MMKKSDGSNILKTLLMVLVISLMTAGISYAGKTVDNKTPLNINQATAKELSTLPGIGKKKAEAITAYREKNGKFGSIEEIIKVDGIGKDTLEGIKNQIVIE